MSNQGTARFQHTVDVSISCRQIEDMLACSTVVDHVKPVFERFGDILAQVLNDRRTFEIRQVHRVD